jgi:hypothetical protein
MRAVANNDGKLLAMSTACSPVAAAGSDLYACNFGLNPAAMMTRMKEG